MKLIHKLTFFGLIATFLSMVVFILLSSYKTTQYIKDIVSKELSVDVGFYADEVDHMIEVRMEDSRTLAASPVFRSGSSEDLDNYLRYISSGSMWIEEIAFFDADWNLISWPTQIEQKTFSLIGVWKARPELINEIKETGQQRIFSFDDEKTNLPVLIVVTPVYTKESKANPYGFLALKLDFDCILSCTGFYKHEQDKNRSYYVLDHKNRILSAPEGLREAGTEFPDIDKFEELEKNNYPDEIVEYVSSKTGVRYLGTVAPLDSMNRVHNLGWKVALISPHESVVGPVRRISKFHVLLGIVVTLFAICMAYILARSLTGPLNRIIAMAAKMKAGDYHARIPIETMSTEFELLSETLNSMAEQVDERTTELIETNEQLINEISSHRETQNALVGEEERFRLMVENLPMGAVYIEENRIFFNRAAEEITGYNRREIKTEKTLNEIIPCRDGMEVCETRDMGSIKAVEGWNTCGIVTKSGEKRFVEMKAYKFEKGEVLIMKDVTEELENDRDREEMQQQLYQAQKMEAIGQLAGGMAHDFNNMIGVIIGSASMALMDIGENEAGYKELKNIVEASRRARDLSTKILTFARKENVVVMSTCIVDVVGSAMNMFKRAMPAEMHISMSAPDVLPNVMVDGMQIEQVLINLFRNSCDAMPEGGSIHVEMREVNSADEDVPLPDDTGFCVLEVSDTGEGMPADVVNRIFEPFFTTKKAGKGTGLGLSVSMGIIRNHGGFINVISEEGKGTKICLYLPIDNQWTPESVNTGNLDVSITDEIAGGKLASKVEDISDPIVVKKEKILVVDDETMMKEVTVAILQSSGYRVISSGSAMDALEIFRSRRSEIALVVLDIMMPVMDGIQALRKLQEIESNIPVIFVSGYVEESYLMDKAPEMVDFFVHKPYESDDLLDKIKAVLASVKPV